MIINGWGLREHLQETWVAIHIDFFKTTYVGGLLQTYFGNLWRPVILRIVTSSFGGPQNGEAMPIH